MDLVVSFDTTGSMSPCIAEVRRKVIEFCNELLIGDTRIALISHGDYCDDVNKINILPFTSDKNSIINFIKHSPNTHGGDADECYELVLNEMCKLDWQHSDKVAILIGDANPHYVGYQYGRVVNNLDWRNEARNLVNQGVNLYPVQCLGHSSSNKFYNELARLSGVNKIELAQFKNIYQVIQAVGHKQRNTLENYALELQNSGQLDRNLSTILNGLMGKTVAHMPTYEDVDLEAVSPSRFQLLHIDNEVDIKSFVLSTGATFKTGKGFYQLTKPELVQERKEVVLVNEAGDMFAGRKARELINLPYGNRGKVNTRDIPKGYKVFIQSTSPNRKLSKNTMFLYEVDYR